MINRFLYKNILTAALASGCFFMSACENDVNEVRALGQKKTGVDEGRNIDSYLSMNGRMKAHLTAPLLLRYQGDSASKAEFPNTLHVDFYNDSAKIESKLRADYGRYMENEHKVFLRGNVIAFNVKGDTLYCPELTWDQNTGKFFTDKRVVLSKGHRSSVFIGLHGMDCTQDFSTINLYTMEPGSFFNIPDSTKGADTTAKPAQ
ncbi:MAG: LPS export ABC transporter periplasmic protein LptC [Chitinophagaceae bacterium]|nr:LPS export ABC transporter periplasmic protein LptC [Chitinophagaceae bacterium]